MEAILAIALFVAIMMAVYFGCRVIADRMASMRTRLPRPHAAFPTIAPPGAHWCRATTIVETSLARTADVAIFHQSAARQLDAAEYALHSLLAELNQVMATTVGSPLVAKREPATIAPRMPTALAA